MVFKELTDSRWPEYRGNIYINKEKRPQCQMVLAHRGTDDLRDWWSTNIPIVYFNMIGGQQYPMHRFVGEAFHAAQKHNCTLATTGHSLGAFLAQSSVFVAKTNSSYPDTCYFPAITFDTPGARPMLEKMNKGINPIDLFLLPTTNYLSSPNLVNAGGNPHLGTVYRVVFKPFPASRGTYTLSSHSIDNFVEAFEPSTGIAKQCHQVHEWPSSNFAYHRFFRYANSSNNYEPEVHKLSGDEVFDLTYKIHYKTTPCYNHQLHMRHIPKQVRAWAKKLFLKNNTQQQIFFKRYLQGFTIQYDEEKNLLTLANSSFDMRLVADYLTTLVTTHGADQLLANLYTPKLFNLPPLITVAVERSQNITTLQKTFASSDTLLVQPITGPPGIGKTQLVRQFIEKEKHNYAHILWIPAATPQDIIEAYTQIATQLGITEETTESKITHIHYHLQSKPCLYVFDNAPNQRAIKKYLPHQGHVLVTSHDSRAKVWVEKPLVVQPFSQTEAIDLAGKLSAHFGYRHTPAEQERLKPLIVQIPRYPLAFTHLLSLLQRRGEEAFKAILTSANQLFDVLGKDTGDERVGYEKGLGYVVKENLKALQQEGQGASSLALLSKLAYLNPSSIPLAWIRNLENAPKKVKDMLLALHNSSPFSILSFDLDPQVDKKLQNSTLTANFLMNVCKLSTELGLGTSNCQLTSNLISHLDLLEKYSLIHWNDNRDTLHLHDFIAKMIRGYHPQTSLQPLLDSFFAYTTQKTTPTLFVSRIEIALPQGRAFFERLTENAALAAPSQRYKLSTTLYELTIETNRFDEAINWAQNRLACSSNKASHNASASIDMGNALVNLYRYSKAFSYYKDGLDQYQRLYEKEDHADIAWAMYNMGIGATYLAKYAEALEVHNNTLAMYQRLDAKPGANHQADKARSLTHRGMAHYNLGNYTQAQQDCEAAVDTYRSLYPNQNDTAYAIALTNQALVEAKLEHDKKALELLKEARTMYQALYPGSHNKDYRNHPTVARCLQYSGTVLSKSGDNEDLRQVYGYSKQALDMYQLFYPGQPRLDIARTLTDAGFSLGMYDARSREKALDYFKEALAIYKVHYPASHVAAGYQDHLEILEWLHRKGMVVRKAEHYETALQVHQQAVLMALRIYKNNTKVIPYCQEFGETLDEINNKTLVKTVYNEIYPQYEQLLGENHALTKQLWASIKNKLGWLWWIY